MALSLSIQAESILKSGVIEPNIILEIEGIGLRFGTIDIVRFARIGDYIIGDGTKIGGGIADENSRDYIQFNGTTNNISQSVEIDRSEGNSITNFMINLVDKNAELVDEFSFPSNEQDILGREAKVYFMPNGGIFPRDASEVFLGIIDAITYGAGNVQLNIAHPQQLTRQEILQAITTQTTAAINNSQSTIPVESANGIFQDHHTLELFVKIDDEIIKVGSISGTNLNGCTRGQLGTIAASHDDEATVETLYRVQGDPINLSLELLISPLGAFGTKSVNRFVDENGVDTIAGAIFFESNIQDDNGLVIGDKISITGATNGANNVTSEVITGFGEWSLGQYVITAAPLVIETTTAAIASFVSKYDKFQFGCGIKPYHIDIERFQELENYFSSSFIDYDFYLSETITTKDFLDAQVFFPSGIYSIPRKGRIGIGYSSPPLAILGTRNISKENIKNAGNIKNKRSTNQKFYNAVVYKYEKDAQLDKFLKATIIQSSESTTRVKVGNKVLTIESDGARNNVATNQAIENTGARFLDRFKLGAEIINISTQFYIGYPVDIGDAIILDSTDLSLANTKQGTRDLGVRIYEVTNKSMNLKTGDINLELTDSSYSLDGRYGVVSPSSLIDSGSTTTVINITTGPWTGDRVEYEQWEEYIGQEIIIRNTDWSSVQTSRIQSVDPYKITLSTAIATPPTTGYIIETPQYNDSANRMQYWKAVHCYLNPQVICTAGGDAAGFNVGAGDVAKFFEGTSVRIRTLNYSDDFQTKVLSIVGLKINTVDPMPFNAGITHYVDLIGFSGDSGAPYLLF
jgi:hypothetical protein